MRKIIAIMLILMVSFVFITGCSDNSPEEQEDGEKTISPPSYQESSQEDNVPMPPALPGE